MREQLAIRIHTSERTNARILYEASPINTSWEDLTEGWREYYRKQADQILSYQREEIEKGLLTDEEIAQAMRDGYVWCPIVSTADRKVAQAQLQKFLALLK